MSEERLVLINSWCKDVGVMHIAHHIAASRYAKWHRWFGVIAAVLAAIVGTSIFASITNDMRSVSKDGAFILGLVSMLSAALTVGMTFLDFKERARNHLMAAADFQRLRREIEEEIVKLAEGKAHENYDMFKDQWHKVLRSVPPLPQNIHDRVKRDFRDGKINNYYREI